MTNREYVINLLKANLEIWTGLEDLASMQRAKEALEWAETRVQEDEHLEYYIDLDGTP